MRKEARKAQVLEAIARLSAARDYPPSYREVANDLRISHSLVHGIVRELKDDGLIHDPTSSLARTLTLTGSGRAALDERLERPAPDLPTA